MDLECSRIREEAEAKFRGEEESLKKRLEEEARESLEGMFEEKESELVRRVREEGTDAVDRQRAHEKCEGEFKEAERRLKEEHRRRLEEGAMERLKEREAQLADQREEIRREMDDEQRAAIKLVSEKLAKDAKEQIAAYRIDLENLREARIKSAQAKEAEKTSKVLADLKNQFMVQATSEMKILSDGADDEERYALKQVSDEIARFQALKATEITTNARAHRAETLPNMAIELEER